MINEQESSVLLSIWTRIVSELALNQDQAPEETAGQVVNSICKMPYILDTACAAKVFAVEYQRTGSEDFHKRAISALDSISTLQVTSGLPEPIGESLGWHEVPGSLAATGMALDFIFDAERILGYTKFKDRDFGSFLSFLSKCYNGKGRFAHNCIVEGRVPSDVQNTTSVALYLLEHLYQDHHETGNFLFTQRELSIRHLYYGQTHDGYWPYTYPKYEWVRTIIQHLYPSLGKRWRQHFAYRDILHHVMTLYFITRYFETSLQKKYIKTVTLGWDWVKNHMIINGDEMVIDWSYESVPTSPCYCNLRDTNTYFWIMALLPHLKKMSVITKSESDEFIYGITNHIERGLMSGVEEKPCIVPHEGPTEILRNILPMFDQGVAWKGAYLAEIIFDSIVRSEK